MRAKGARFIAKHYSNTTQLAYIPIAAPHILTMKVQDFGEKALL